MKNVLLLIGLFCLPFLCQGQNRAIKNFYHKYKKQEGARNVMLPGFLIWMGSGIAKGIVKDENPEAKVFLRFAKKFKTMRVLVMEEDNMVSKEDLNKLIVGAKKGKYEEIISVREGGKNISIMARGKKEKLKNLLIIVSGESEFVMLNAKTNIRVKDINRLINDLMEIEKYREKILREKEVQEEVIPAPVEKKKKDKKPIRA